MRNGMSKRQAMWAAALLFVVEIGIALFVRDGFVRPYLGDVFAAALVYFLLRAVFDVGRKISAAVAFSVAVAVELLQLTRLLELAGLGDHAVVRTVFGGVFDYHDILAYLVGVAVAFVVDGALGRAASRASSTARSR